MIFLSPIIPVSLRGQTEFEEELLAVERFLQSATFVWGLRIFTLGFVILLVRKNEWLDRAWQKRKVKYSLYAVYGIGVIGWILAIIDLAS